MQERGGCHGLVNHRYVLTHTLDGFGEHEDRPGSVCFVLAAPK